MSIREASDDELACGHPHHAHSHEDCEACNGCGGSCCGN
jgi:hypothetical protein